MTGKSQERRRSIKQASLARTLARAWIFLMARLIHILAIANTTLLRSASKVIPSPNRPPLHVQRTDDTSRDVHLLSVRPPSIIWAQRLQTVCNTSNQNRLWLMPFAMQPSCTISTVRQAAPYRQFHPLRAVAAQLYCFRYPDVVSRRDSAPYTH